MVTNVNVVLQKRNADDQWIVVEVDEFFLEGGYALIAWLAGIRNYSGIEPLALPRGLPNDFIDIGYVGEHDFSWLSIAELISVNFEQVVEDRRYTGVDSRTGLRDGRMTCSPGFGRKCTLRSFLGERVVADIEKAHALGVERIVFGFDS